MRLTSIGRSLVVCLVVYFVGVALADDIAVATTCEEEHHRCIEPVELFLHQEIIQCMKNWDAVPLPELGGRVDPENAAFYRCLEQAFNADGVSDTYELCDANYQNCKERERRQQELDTQPAPDTTPAPVTESGGIVSNFCKLLLPIFTDTDATPEHQCRFYGGYCHCGNYNSDGLPPRYEGGVPGINPITPPPIGSPIAIRFPLPVVALP